MPASAMHTPETKSRKEAFETTISARAVTKSYGLTVALKGVDLDIRRGEVLGLVGHNGAGKSTLTRILAGREQPDSGEVQVHGVSPARTWTSSAAEHAGVRMVYQELALCPDLTVIESGYLSEARAPRIWGWRGQAERRISEVLDMVFPGHGIAVVRRVGELTMAERQMVEIARGLCTDNLSFLILDEPTESLSVELAQYLYAHLDTLTARGVSVLLISHRMHEVIAHSDRIAVMRDGALVDVLDSSSATEDSLLSAMGGEVRADTATLHHVQAHASDLSGSDKPIGKEVASIQSSEGISFKVRAGEVIGLAGLAGQGQESVLTRLWSPGRLNRSVTSPTKRAYVPGDRQTSGILPRWGVADNLTISALRELSSAGVVNRRRKKILAQKWIASLRIRGDLSTPITALSGGNQQKVLVARAFATDADLILLDDPFRGVDVSTKNELYALMKVQAAAGRAVVWYSTENSEMTHCDRAYVFRGGRIVSELHGPAITEERIIADSFGEAPVGPTTEETR